jgi:hypothetical protein
MAYSPLTVGGVTFQNIEIPEFLDAVGGYQSSVVHDYPGGLRTIRNLGAFPQPIEWHGILFGSNALSRTTQLERLFVTGNDVSLTYANVNLLGRVLKFRARLRHQFYVPYDILFMPKVDKAGIIASPITPTSTEVQVLNTSTAMQNLNTSNASTGANTWAQSHVPLVPGEVY